MKVIFLKTIKNIGRQDEVKDVNDGYAQNFLFPQKIAVPANEKSIASLKKKLESIKIDKDIQNNLLDKNLESIKDVSIEVSLPANNEGHLFSGIHSKDIIEFLSQNNINIDEKLIDLEKPIKTTGTHDIKVRVGNKSSSFYLKITQK